MSKTSEKPGAAGAEQEEPLEKSLTERLDESLARLDAGQATDADYALVAQVSQAAVDVVQKSAPPAAGRRGGRMAKPEAEDEGEDGDESGDEDEGEDGEDAAGDRRGDAGDGEGDEEEDEEGDEAEKSFRATAECPECGNDVHKSFRFCVACGSELAKSLFSPEPLFDDADGEDGESVQKSMYVAAELGGAEDGEEYVNAEPILEALGKGVDQVLSELRQLDRRLGKVEKSLRQRTPAPVAAGPAGAAGAAGADGEAESAGDNAALKKSMDQRTADQLRSLIQPLENRLEELQEAVSARAVSPHPPRGDRSDRFGKGGAGLHAGNGHGLSIATREDLACTAVQTAFQKSLISQDAAAACCNNIGNHREVSPEEHVRRLVPAALPLLNELLESQA